MCGLACIFSYGIDASPVDSIELNSIRERMYTRGPDSFGTWISDNSRVGLTHRRLAIIDTSDAAVQPMLDEATGNRIVFNGEIYNFIELREHLELKGYAFRTKSDTEVLLILYRVYEEKMLNMLRGMFSFVIWDNAKEGIFAARDHFGIKPLYIADDGHIVRFASQVKALIAGGAVDLTAEPAGHVGFFLWGFVPEPFTMFKGIRALPAGTSLWVDKRGTRHYRQFFNLSEEYCKGISLGKNLEQEDKHEILHDALLDSVRHHMISDVPIGVFLSAGLDSCSIANLVKESGEKSLHTVTLGFNEFIGTSNDEVPLAEMASQHIGALHQTKRISKDDFYHHYDVVLDAMDQPSIDGVNTYFVCKAAKDAGLKVALSGLGGDELFAGYSYFQTIPKIMRIAKPFAKFPAIGIGIRKFLSSYTGKLVPSKIAGLLEYGASYQGAYLLSRCHYMPWEIKDMVGNEFFSEGWNDLQTISAIEDSLGPLKSDREAISALELQWYMRSQLLRDSDWASMAHSLELRVPFVDVELFKSICILMGAGVSPTKLDMASACKKMLPQCVLKKPKTGFSIPVQKWIMRESDKPSEDSRSDLKLWSELIYKSYTNIR